MRGFTSTITAPFNVPKWIRGSLPALLGVDKPLSFSMDVDVEDENSNSMPSLAPRRRKKLKKKGSKSKATSTAEPMDVDDDDDDVRESEREPTRNHLTLADMYSDGNEPPTLFDDHPQPEQKEEEKYEPVKENKDVMLWEEQFATVIKQPYMYFVVDAPEELRKVIEGRPGYPRGAFRTHGSDQVWLQESTTEMDQDGKDICTQYGIDPANIPNSKPGCLRALAFCNYNKSPAEAKELDPRWTDIPKPTSRHIYFEKIYKLNMDLEIKQTGVIRQRFLIEESVIKKLENAEMKLIHDKVCSSA